MAEPSSLITAGMTLAATYHVERLLGKGGMGEVWLARHLRLAGKQVAIKVLHLQNPNAELLSRFRREAEIAARLEHPNIVQVLDFNQLPTGEPYLVMEFLKGESLAGRLRKAGGALPVAQVQGIVLQIGSALQAAHAAGIVHRDLKPDNIFLVPTALGDQVKVLDFGISKLNEGASSLQTTEKTLVGTPLYMSPEQALGLNRDTTSQSDLFSLGSICYELLTGVAPFVADSVAQVVFRIAYQPHIPLKQVLPGLPANVVHAVEHALIKERTERTQNISTFIRELTGEELGAVDRTAEPSSGVYTPGMNVSKSLMMNATVTPSKSMTMPKPGGVAPASKRSWVVPAVAGAAGLAVVAAITVVVILPERRSSQVQAKPSESGPLPTADAGHVAQNTDLTPVFDAGAPIADAGLPLPVKHGVALPFEKMPADERRVIQEMQAYKRAKNWPRLAGALTAALNSAKSRTSRAEVLTLALEAQCALNDLSQMNAIWRRLKDLPGSAVLEHAKEICRRHQPGWEP